MPLFEETNPNKKTEDCGFETKTNPNQTQNQKPSGLTTIIGQLLPLAHFAFEQFTGQKVTPMSGTIAEMQMTLTQIQSNLQTIANNQQALNQRLIALETNAGQQLTNLVQQFNSLRLIHTKERKQIQYGADTRLSPNLEENNEEY